MDDKEKSKEQLLEEISQLRENYQCYRFLFDNAPLSYISIDKNGKILKLNKTCLDYLKYSEDDIIGDFFINYIPPEYREIGRAHV